MYYLFVLPQPISPASHHPCSSRCWGRWGYPSSYWSGCCPRTWCRSTPSRSAGPSGGRGDTSCFNCERKNHERNNFFKAISKRSCCGSVDKTMDSQSWGPQFESAGSGSSALGQGTYYPHCLVPLKGLHWSPGILLISSFAFLVAR